MDKIMKEFQVDLPREAFFDAKANEIRKALTERLTFDAALAELSKPNGDGNGSDKG